MAGERHTISPCPLAMNHRPTTAQSESRSLWILPIPLQITMVLYVEWRKEKALNSAWLATLECSQHWGILYSPKLRSICRPVLGKCFAVFNLYWGFNAWKMDEASCDMTAFQTPLRLLHYQQDTPIPPLNSRNAWWLCIFHDEIAKQTINVFINNVPIWGPLQTYPNKDGNPAVLPKRLGIWGISGVVPRHGGGKGWEWEWWWDNTHAQSCAHCAISFAHSEVESGRLGEVWERVKTVIMLHILSTCLELRGWVVREEVDGSKNKSKMTQCTTACILPSPEAACSCWVEECTRPVQVPHGSQYPWCGCGYMCGCRCGFGCRYSRFTCAHS